MLEAAIKNKYSSSLSAYAATIRAAIPAELSGVWARTAEISAPSDRLSDFMRAYDARGERAVALAQGAIALFILLLHLGARLGKDVSTLNVWVVCALSALIASSVLRAQLTKRHRLPEATLNALSVADVAIFLLLIWSYQFAYDHPAGGVLKAPSLSILFVLVALRALRFHPLPLVITGSAAVIGWCILLIAALGQNGSGGVTHDYVAYLTTYEILLGAEIEKLVALIALVAFLAFATHRARDGLLQLDSTLEHMPQGVAMFDAQRRLVVCNGLYGELYGMTRGEVKPGTTITELVGRRQRKGIYGRDGTGKDFANRWLAEFDQAVSRVQELADGRILSIKRTRKPNGGIISTTEDITDRRRLEARIEYMAYHDALTGLANRVHLHERLDQILTGRRRNDGVVALCVDLDQFKDVNDTYGHYVGDALLRAVAQRLQDSVRDADVLARMGGDEFVVLQTAVDSSAAAAALAGRMIDEISAPYELFGHQVTIGVSVGLSVSYEQTVDADELIKQADLALYKAKQDGRGVFRFFEEEMNARLQERRRMERDLRTALSDDQFELYYQPVVNIERDEIAGVEALIRWHHPERGVVSPGEFIPIVEEIGLAGPVGEWVIKQACQDAANWSDDIKVAINVSAAQFRNPGLLDIVKDALSSSGLKSSRLELEITETVLLDDSETTLGILNELRELGVRVAMDDFGTGYASLSYLQKFPFDRIKIDRSFIDEITKDGSAIEIVRTVIALSKGLGMATTAEGVETSDQLTAIVSEGCSDVQGFLVSRPRPRPEIEALFATFDGCRSLGDY